VTNGRVNVLFVWPLSTFPSLRQTLVKGPLPDGVVLKVAVLPGQLVRLINCVALTLLSTVNVALFVTLPHAPLTDTL